MLLNLSRRQAADRLRLRVLRLRAEGHSLAAIAGIVRRSHRRVEQILAEYRARFETERDPEAPVILSFPRLAPGHAAARRDCENWGSE